MPGRHEPSTSRKRWSVLVLSAAVIASGAGDARGQVTERITVSSSGEQANSSGVLYGVAFSARGEVVAFASDATNLVPRDTNRESDVFVRDRRTGLTHRVSVAAAWGQANGPSFAPGLSADGRVVAFLSEATNLVQPRPRREGRAGVSRGALSVFFDPPEGGRSATRSRS